MCPCVGWVRLQGWTDPVAEDPPEGGRHARQCAARAAHAPARWLPCCFSASRAGPWCRAADRPLWHPPRDTRLSTTSINTIIARRARDTGLVGDYGGHSLRRGFATSALAAGATERAVQRHGRWASPTSIAPYVDESARIDSTNPTRQSGGTTTYRPPGLYLLSAEPLATVPPRNGTGGCPARCPLGGSFPRNPSPNPADHAMYEALR